MVNDGDWGSNMTYMTCDDYDGNNSPRRNGLNLKKHLFQVSVKIFNQDSATF